MTETKGRVLHAAACYDLLACLLLLGREEKFRQRLVRLARLKSGEFVLDVGCGTGSLAIAAKEAVGAHGIVEGVDASQEMIARATTKAAKARVDVRFTNSVVEALPFRDQQFDVVLSTLMMHHLPRDSRVRALREIVRVLKPDGRVLVADFDRPSRKRRTFLEHFHRHGGVELNEIVKLMTDAGLEIGETGAVGLIGVQFVLGRVRP